jgi:hypothetical protein
MTLVFSAPLNELDVARRSHSIVGDASVSGVAVDDALPPPPYELAIRMCAPIYERLRRSANSIHRGLAGRLPTPAATSVRPTAQLKDAAGTSRHNSRASPDEDSSMLLPPIVVMPSAGSGAGLAATTPLGSGTGDTLL